MSDLVGNPEDRFSHNEAHFNSEMIKQRYGIFSNTLIFGKYNCLHVTVKMALYLHPSLISWIIVYSHAGTLIQGIYHMFNGENDNGMLEFSFLKQDICDLLAK